MARGMGPRGFLTEEEKKNKPKITWALVKRIGSYLWPYKLQMAAVLTVIFVATIVGLFPSIITGRIIDTALMNKDMPLLFKLVGLALIALFASQFIGVLESYINAWISQQIIYDMKNEMFEHLQTMPHAFFTTEKQGDIITRMNSDISGVSSVISGTLTSLVTNILTVITTAVTLFTLNVKLGCVGILIIPFLILPTKSAGQNRWKILTEGQGKRDEMNEIINESLSVSGSLLIKLFAKEDVKNEQFRQINRDVCDLSIKETRAGKWFRVIMGIFTNIGPLLIYLVGGYLLIHDSTITIGMITTTVSLVNRLYRPVESLLNVGVELTRSFALFTRIFDYLDRNSPIVSKKDALIDGIDITDIEYDHVRFGYNEEVILKGVSFKIESGKSYALVGKSGSGKSTIANLLPRLYDVNEGKVCINGIDVRDFDLKYLRDNIGVVTQEAYLFNGTIRDNLLFVDKDASDEKLIEVCKQANIYDFILNQKDGFDTVVGNRGLKLSGGEKQRLSIARVLLKNPKILILDEATSALDSISEEAIQTALQTLMEGRTSLVIAHRLSTILASDQIMVIDEGVIKESGTHEQLIEKAGLYKELYETQFRKVIEMEMAQ